MPRFVFGPSAEHAELGDVSVSLTGVQRGGCVKFSVGEADPEFSQALQGLHVVYLPSKPADEQSAEDVFRNASLIGSADAEALKAGGEVVVQVPGVPPGRHWIQSILEFAE